MLYHNIMVSDDQRLAKEVLEQQIDEEHEESFANQVREEAAARDHPNEGLDEKRIEKESERSGERKDGRRSEERS